MESDARSGELRREEEERRGNEVGREMEEEEEERKKRAPLSFRILQHASQRLTIRGANYNSPSFYPWLLFRVSLSRARCRTAKS